jgi:hypothetical protein
MESMQLFIRANEVTKTIEDADTRGSALSELGQALAQAQQWDRAEAVWHEATKHERCLVVVQHAWLQSTSRNEALSLLQIANPFITLKPELGVAFFEAFAWGDAFLKG